MQRQIEAIASLIEAKITAAAIGTPLKSIKNVYRGDPIIIPVSSLPAITIRMPNVAVTPRDNVRDQRLYSAQIRYVYNIRDTMGNSNPKDVAFETLANNLFLKEETGGSLNKDCITQILRDDDNLKTVGKIQTDFSVNGEYTDIRGYLAFESSLNFSILQLGVR